MQNLLNIHVDSDLDPPESTVYEFAIFIRNYVLYMKRILYFNSLN